MCSDHLFYVYVQLISTIHRFKLKNKGSYAWGDDLITTLMCLNIGWLAFFMCSIYCTKQDSLWEPCIKMKQLLVNRSGWQLWGKMCKNSINCEQPFWKIPSWIDWQKTGKKWWTVSSGGLVSGYQAKPSPSLVFISPPFSGFLGWLQHTSHFLTTPSHILFLPH